MDEGGKILDLGIGWTVGLRFQQFVRVSISFHLAADNPDGYVSSAYLYRSIRKFVAFLFFVFCCENAPGRMTDFLRHICPSNWIFLLWGWLIRVCLCACLCVRHGVSRWIFEVGVSFESPWRWQVYSRPSRCCWMDRVCAGGLSVVQTFSLFLALPVCFFFLLLLPSSFARATSPCLFFGTLKKRPTTSSRALVLSGKRSSPRRRLHRPRIW